MDSYSFSTVGTSYLSSPPSSSLIAISLSRACLFEAIAIFRLPGVSPLVVMYVSIDAYLCLACPALGLSNIALIARKVSSGISPAAYRAAFSIARRSPSKILASITRPTITSRKHRPMDRRFLRCSSTTMKLWSVTKLQAVRWSC